MQWISLVGGAEYRAAQMSNAAYHVPRDAIHSFAFILVRIEYAVESIANAIAFPAAIVCGKNSGTNNSIQAGSVTAPSVNRNALDRTRHEVSFRIVVGASGITLPDALWELRSNAVFSWQSILGKNEQVNVSASVVAMQSGK
jgi:hypothetical protein